MDRQDVDIAVVGAGIAGIAAAYYIGARQGTRSIALIDAGPPMALTSAWSGDNYRNWWPHPVMTDFTDHSIDLMERIARDTGNRLRMSRRGYVLATRRADIGVLIERLFAGYGAAADGLIRVHEAGAAERYRAASTDWESAPEGVDVVCDSEPIRRAFPSYDRAVRNILHVRRAGHIDGQQMGQYMLERLKARGTRRTTGRVVAIERGRRFDIEVRSPEGTRRVSSEVLVNAAGPFVDEIARMLGVELPIQNVLQQKLAFEDTRRAIPRSLPFSIDLDEQLVDWAEGERDLLSGDEDLVGLTGTMPGAVHCRPEGGDRGSWIKLGWAFNQTPAEAAWAPALDDHFPEIVLRGAARLHPALKGYYGRLPRGTAHYGGWYTMTEENWPLIGSMGIDGAFVVGALSGFGTMAACAAGALCACWISGAERPAYANALSLGRYQDRALMNELAAQGSRGIL